MNQKTILTPDPHCDACGGLGLLDATNGGRVPRRASKKESKIETIKCACLEER